MKVTINHEEQTKGLFANKKEYEVTLLLEFSEEEKSIIKKHNLSNTVVRTVPSPLRSDPDATFDVTIGFLLKGPRWVKTFSTPIEAKNWDEELKNDILPMLKSYISANAEPLQKSQTFNL